MCKVPNKYLDIYLSCYYHFFSFDANPESYSNPDVLRLVEGIATRAIQLDKKVH